MRIRSRFGGAYFAGIGDSILRATETELYVDFSDPPPIGQFEVKGEIFPDPWGGGHETNFGYRVEIRPAALTGDVPLMVETFIIEHHFDTDREISYTLPSRLVVGTAAPTPVRGARVDAGLTPPRPEELGDEMLNGEGGIIYVGTKGKMMQLTYGREPRLLPRSLHETTGEPKALLPRVAHGHDELWFRGQSTPCRGGCTGPSDNGSSEDHA